MIQMDSNIAEVTAKLIGMINAIANPDTVSRAVAVAMMPQIRERIHVEGKNSNDQQIGTYSNEYLKRRQKKFNRTSDSDVIASLTRQLENSYVVAADDKGYTIGVATPLSAEKIKWLEERYGTIWNLTQNELQQSLTVAVEETNKLLNANS